MTMNIINAHRQRGAVLIVSLIILLVMTLLAVTAMQNTTLEEKMAGNTRDMALALSAAEAGLRGGETVLSGSAVLPPFNGTVTGYYAPDNSRWSQAVTWTSNSIVYATTIPGVAAQPRYYLEEMPAVVSGGSLEVGVAMEVGMYRITAIGYGAANTTTAIVQSTFRR